MPHSLFFLLTAAFFFSTFGCGGLFATTFTARSKRCHASDSNSMSLEPGFLDMPQPINRIVRDPHIYLDCYVLADKPDLAVIVCQIFAVWATIEQELNFLFYVVLGADAAPAIAIYSELRTQNLQSVALEAAAKAALTPEDHEIFKAAISITDNVKTTRNHLAHWAWAGCKQRPDLLALCDPKMIKERDFRVALHIKSKGDPENVHPLEYGMLHLFDTSKILAYTKDDLERSLRDLVEAASILAFLRHYLDPSALAVVRKTMPNLGIPPGQERAELLRSLNDRRLFREALDRTRASQKSTPR